MIEILRQSHLEINSYRVALSSYMGVTCQNFLYGIVLLCYQPQ